MTKPKVWVYFYGSFINRDVLARGGLTPERVEVARLWGFDIVVETLATLVRSDRSCVYGIVCETTDFGAGLQRLDRFLERLQASVDAH